MNLREKGTLGGTKIPNSSILYPIGQSQQLWGRGQKVVTLLPIMQCSLGSYRRRRHIQIEFVVRYLPRSSSFSRVLQFSHLLKNLYFQLKLDQELELFNAFKLVFLNYIFPITENKQVGQGSFQKNRTLDITLQSICSEQLNTYTIIPRARPRSLVVSVLPVPAGPAGAPLIVR